MKMNVEDFTPAKGRLVIKKNRELTSTITDITTDIPENDGKNPVEDTMEIKEIKRKATNSVQLGTVVAVNPEDPYEIGDTIAYGIHTLKEFDLFKGKHGLLDVYNVLGVYNIK